LDVSKALKTKAVLLKRSRKIKLLYAKCW
jgi:hypothetical protein